MTILLNVFVIHAKSLGIRKDMCEKLRGLLDKVKGLRTTFQYVEENDPTDLMRDDPNKLVNLDPLPAIAGMAEDDPKNPVDFNKMLRPISLPCLSNTMKHYKALCNIRDEEDNDNEYNLVVEDDVCFSDNVGEQLLGLLKSLPQLKPEGWDVIFFGFPHPTPEGAPQELTLTATNDVYRVFPGCDSYLVSKAGATRLANAFLPIKLVTNAHLSLVAAQNDVAAYMCSPNLFVEGSKLGVYVSCLNPNNMLLYNNNYKDMFQLVQGKNAYTEEDRAAFDKLWDENRFRQHPDVMYLKGLYKMKDRQFKEAGEVFGEVFDLYKKNECPLNKDSVFLNNYIELFKVLQENLPGQEQAVGITA